VPIRRKFSRPRAFTLIEVLIAITVFSLVMAAIYSTWLMIMRASHVGQEAAAQVQRQRIAVRTIEDALTCIQSFQASMRYYSFGVTNGDAPSLSFTARLPDNFLRSGKFGDYNVRHVTFSVEPGADSEKDLVLRQNPILMDMDADEQQTPLLLARNVQSFVIECWDTNAFAWDDEWDATNSIPPMVRITLALGGNSHNVGGAIPLRTVTRVVSMPSQTLPATVQTPPPGAPANPGAPPGQLQLPGGGGVQINPPAK
jgi:prepilin-type N-terminal cleavage/methylation domain-containing protein